MIKIEKSYKGISIVLQLLYAGNDLCILITGGEQPHVGAISIYSKDEGIQTISLIHHKDFVISELCINSIKDSVDGNISVSCGIHIDNISKEQIRDVGLICSNIFQELKEGIENR